MAWADTLCQRLDKKSSYMSGSACPALWGDRGQLLSQKQSEGLRRFWGYPKMPDPDYLLLAIQLVRLMRLLLQLLAQKRRGKK
jgi:hypothetical protein